MRCGNVYMCRTGAAGCLRSAQDGRTRGDHVVVQDDLAALDLTDERVPGDDSAGPSLFHKGEIDFAPQLVGEDFPHPLGALHAADVGRGDDNGFAAEVGGERRCEHLCSLEPHRLAAECVVECRFVVNVQYHDSVDACGLEHRGDVARGDRIPGLGAAILARVRKVGHYGSHVPCAGILQCSDEEQQAAELVVGRRLRIAARALDDAHVTPLHVSERAHLVFTAVELALLARRQRTAQ